MTMKRPERDIHLQSRPAHTIPARTVKTVVMDWAKTAKLIEKDGYYACRIDNEGNLKIYEICEDKPEEFERSDFIPLE